MTDDRLPNLVIAGVPKAGTTSLFDYLAQHPEVHPARVKQTGFFKQPLGERDTSLAGYAAHFRGAGAAAVVMEATPGYFVHATETAPRMARVLDRPRVLISLREPVARLRSHHRMLAREGALAPGEERFEAFVAPLLSGTAAPGSRLANLFEIGRYDGHLATWWEVFGDDLRIVFFDDLVGDPRAVVRSLCGWLGIATAPVGSVDVGARNRGARYRSRTVARRARAAVRLTAPIWQRYPRLKAHLRATHDAMNTRAPVAPRGADAREADTRLGALYRPALERLATDLAAHGHRNLPAWVVPEVAVPARPGPAAGRSS